MIRPKSEIVPEFLTDVITLLYSFLAMALIKKLTKIGNSWGVILSIDLMKLAGFEPDDEYEIEVEEGAILLRPHRTKEEKKDKRIMETMERLVRKYRGDLEKLLRKTK
jgi:antitoxin component of MazEF toxin-antitoxin module